jgi:hypothetical protein
LERQNERGLITSVISHLEDGGVAILQYVDHIILLLKDDFINGRNDKFVMCIFLTNPCTEHKFHKSEIYFLGDAIEREHL